MKKRIGTFYTSGRIENHVDQKKSARVPKLLVDTGAEFTWINAETLKKIGVKREKKDYTFIMANGQQLTRAVGFAIIRVGDALTIDEVIFGEPGDLQILGARSLEGMNLRADSRAKKTGGGWADFGRMKKNAAMTGKKTLADSGLLIISGDSMAEAAEKVVKAAIRFLPGWREN